MSCPIESTLVDAYRREMLSFLQYVDQTSPYAGTADRPLVERIRQMASSVAAQLGQLVDYLDRRRVTVPYLGAFPTTFTNYNFVAVRSLVPQILADESRGLADLERELASTSAGEGREWLEKLAATKRMHVAELQKLVA